MPTSWSGRTPPSTSYSARTVIVTGVEYDNTYVYDAALLYDAYVGGTIYSARSAI